VRRCWADSLGQWPHHDHDGGVGDRNVIASNKRVGHIQVIAPLHIRHISAQEEHEVATSYSSIVY